MQDLIFNATVMHALTLGREGPDKGKVLEVMEAAVLKEDSAHASTL